MVKYILVIVVVFLLSCKDQFSGPEPVFPDIKKIRNITSFTEYPASGKMITKDSMFNNRWQRWRESNDLWVLNHSRKKLGLNSIETDTTTISYRVIINYGEGWSGFEEDPISFTISKNDTAYELEICENRYCNNYLDTGLTSCITKKIYEIDSVKFNAIKAILEENDLYKVPSFPYENGFSAHDHKYYIEFNDGEKYKLLKLHRRSNSTILFALKLFKFLRYDPKRIKILEEALVYYKSKH